MENNTFTISPMNQQIFLYPGQVYEGYININSSSAADIGFKYQAAVTPYGVQGPEYSIDLYNESDRNSIVHWIKIEEPVGIVEPNQSKSLKFTITVPENAPIGGQYATIAISSNNDTNSQETATIQSVFEIASVIYANVNGEIIHDGEIQENQIPGFAFSAPISIGATLINNGNTHETARITITVTDCFSGQEIVPNGKDNGIYDEFIMPGTTRHITHEISDLPSLGVFKITQSIGYNTHNSYQEKIFIICPVWFIALIAITVVAIISTIIILIKKHRRRKKILPL